MIVHSLRSQFAKLRTHANLLMRDPERFGRNLLQFTNRPLFEQRLTDVLDMVPMHVEVDPHATVPHLNILNSALSKSGMTGGPNTIVNLALRIARLGLPIRMVTTVRLPEITEIWFNQHAAQLLGDRTIPNVPIVTAADPAKPLKISSSDIFLASHWTTAQQLKPILPKMRTSQFFYILQEFEPAFYAWSSNYALAMETYGLDFWPVFNEALLADFVLSQSIGRLPSREMLDRAIVFEPAVDGRLFNEGRRSTDARPRRLLFYARPSNTRNLFGLGLLAIRNVAQHPAFKGWEFIAIGSRDSLPNLRLGGDRVLQVAPWMDYEGYAASLHSADILLCPMLSPHTSYPVLEMAACGGLSVTNTFATKTAEALRKISARIIPCEPTIEALASGLLEAAALVNAGKLPPEPINLARDWSQTLDPAAAKIRRVFQQFASAQ